MNARVFLRALLVALLAASATQAQVFDDTVAALLQPLPPTPPGASATGGLARPVGPLAPAAVIQSTSPEAQIVAATPGQRPRVPRRPPFQFQDGDVVLMMGDRVMWGEVELGYFETRLTSEATQRKVTFRNLGWSTNNPLCHPTAGSEQSLKELLRTASVVKPSVVLIGYGSEASAAGAAGLGAFKTNYLTLVAGLKAQVLDTNKPLRLVLLAPVAHEAVPPAASPTNENARVTLYWQAVREIAERENTDFVDFFNMMQNDMRIAARLQEKDGRPYWPYTEDGTKLTPYGYTRLTLALEQGIRIFPNNWRFGVMADSSLRSGQFGTKVTSIQHTTNHARMVCLEERLPSPNVPARLDLHPNMKPQCYIQIVGFESGMYALTIDNRNILMGSDADWARYEIVGQGPQWDQAEELRTAIVKKNQLVTARWQAKADMASDAEIAQAEARIARLKVPVEHTFQVTRVGDRLPQSTPAQGSGALPSPAAPAKQPSPARP